MKRYVFFGTIAALLAGCGQQNEPAATNSETGKTNVTDDSEAASESEAAIAAIAAIPATVQGRWGLVSADCETGRSDAKGLLEISPTRLTFYESRGTLGEIEERGDSRIRAAFAFTGEGMEWTRDMALEVQDGGETLIRREYGEDATDGPLTYTRCPQ